MKFLYKISFLDNPKVYIGQKCEIAAEPEKDTKTLSE